MTATQVHPSDRIETPQLPLAPLGSALTEEEHLKKLEDERLAREEEERQRKAELEEQERVAKEALKEIEYNEDVSEVIAKTVDEHVAALEEEMADLKKKNEELDKQMEIMHKKIWEQRQKMGGVNAGKENHDMLVKQIKLMEKMRNQHIIRLYEVIDTSKYVILIMEYVGGGSLHGYLKSKPKRRLEEWDAKRIFKQIIEGLRYCHSRCITHRDIKLENFVFDSADTDKGVQYDHKGKIVRTWNVKGSASVADSVEVLLDQNLAFRHRMPEGVAEVWLACNTVRHALVAGYNAPKKVWGEPGDQGAPGFLAELNERNPTADTIAQRAAASRRRRQSSQS